MKKIHNQLKNLLARYDCPQTALMQFLKIIKDENEIIEPEDITVISKMCNVRTEEIIKIIDHYSYFSDTGVETIYVCNDLPCYLNGSENLFEKLSAEQSKLNGKSKPVITGHCLGYCHSAPVFRDADGSLFSGN